MYIEFDVPELNIDLRPLGGYWMQIIFIGGWTASPQVQALANNYMRLTESSVIEYRAGRESVLEYWNSHNSVAIGAIHRASSHFETCVTNMHRAVNFLRQLRRQRDLPPRLGQILQVDRPMIVRDTVSGQLRRFRDAIHHVDEMIVDGRYESGQPAALLPGGLEIAHPAEENQTIKTIDRISIGSQELRLPLISEWLTEMHGIASQLAEYFPDKSP